MTHSNKQNGFILMPVIIAIVLIATIAFMLNNQSAINVRQTGELLQAEQAEQVAQAGLAHAVWRAQNSNCSGDMSMVDVAFGQTGGSSYTTTADAGGVSATTATFIADRDTWIDESSPDDATGGVNPTLAIMQVPGSSKRALVHFDLSSIPPGDRVVSATAGFFVDINDASGVISLHAVTADWTEADASWNTIGAGFDIQAHGFIPPQPDKNVTVTVNLTALVQSWVNDPASNRGVMLLTASDQETRLASREDGTTSQRPWLQVSTASGRVSPVTLTASGTLAGNPSPANDISRTLTRTEIPAYQPTSTLPLQPGAEGKDAMIHQWKATWNYGSSTSLYVRDWGSDSDYYSLLQFNLGGIPPGAKVHSAQLALYQNTTSTAGGSVAVQRITGGWVEGAGNGSTAPGATWNERDSGVAWTAPGGDFATEAYAATTIPAGTSDWFSWDITALVDGWVSGTYPNQGLALVPESTNAYAQFLSSDATDPTLHPRLTVSYACECGSPCLAPQGAGNILMMVGDDSPSAITPGDSKKKALFESWGYVVNLQNDNSSAGGIQSAATSNDVVYVSESVDDTTLGNKLTALTIGVINEEGLENSPLGIASGSAWPVGPAINVTDTSHYITALFPTGPLDIYTAGMEQLTVSGTEAPGLQTLADTGGAGALVVLDEGADLVGGGSAAGRRVMLPLGREGKFNWDYLNSNGQLLVQRALQWGEGAVGVAPTKNLLFVSGGSGIMDMGSGEFLVIPTALEQQRIDLIESWGYTVNLILASDTQANFDTAVGENDVAYISSEVDPAQLNTKMVNAIIGVVNELATLVDELGIAQESIGYKSRTEIDVLDNTHYITQPFPTGVLTILNANQDLHLLTSNIAPGFDALAQVFNTGTLWIDSLGAINTGGDLYGGGTAAGRRVLLPWGGATFDVSALNADGLTLMQRAIEWAEGAGAAPAPGYNVLMIVGNLTLSSKDIGYKALIESWGHTVSLIDDGDSQANYDTAMAAADVILASGSAIGSSILDKPTNTTKGIVNEVNGKIDNFGFSSSTSATANFDIFDITSPTHYITEPFSGNPVTVFTSALTNPVPGGTLAPDLQKIGFNGGTLALGTLDTGATRYDGNPSTGRRVHLPYDIAETTDMTDDGKTILKRALEWAAGADAGPACSADYVPNNKVSEFGPVSNIHGLAYFPAAMTFNGSTAPDGGAWISIDQNGLIRMTDLAGIELTSCSISLGGTEKTEGITFVESGTYANHLAVAIDKTSDSNIVYLQSDCSVSATSVLPGIYSAAGISYIGTTVSGSYDGYLAIADFGLDDEVYIVDQAGVQAKVITVTSIVDNLKSIVHLPGSDKLLLPNGSAGQAGAIIDFVNYTGALDTYDMASLGADTPEGAAINPLTCDHALADIDTGNVVTLDSTSGGGGPAGIAFENFSDASGSGNSLSINKPTSTAENDLLIVAVATDGDTRSSLTAPAGWNELRIDAEGGEVTMGVWWKLAGASEGASYSFSWSGSEEYYGWMMRFTGHDIADPIGGDTNDKGSSSAPLSKAVSTAEDNSLVLRLGAFDDDDINAGNPGLPGHTAINMGDSGNGPATVSGGSGYVLQPIAGDSGDSNFSLTNTEEFVTVTISISPAP